MHGDDLVELLLGHLAKSRVAGDPGVVDHDVEAAEPFDGGGDESVDLIGFCHITADGERNLVASELLRRGLCGTEVQIAEHHARALGDELFRDRVPEALRASCDDGGLTGQQRHLITPLGWSEPYESPVKDESYFIYDSQSQRAGRSRSRYAARRGASAMTTTEVSDEDFQDILAQTRTFVRTAVVPREQEILADDRVPDDLREQAKKMGLFGYAIPQEWGGLGLNLAQDVDLAMELGYTSLALRSMFGTNNGIAGQVLVGFGTDEQKARWLEPMATGDVVASFALTEPGAGSNPSGLRTKAVRDGDDWIINGQKRFITNAPMANLFIVFARTRPADDDGAGIAVFLVPADAAGVVVGAKDAKMGQEGAWTSDVSFDDVRVPAAALIGGSEDIGYRAAMISLARGRVHIAALAVGTAQRALDESVAYAATATQGGTPIGNFQLVQAMIADQQTGVLAGRALVRDTARSWVSGEDRRIAPSAAKLFCTEMVGQVADLAVQIHGGSGYMREVPVERIYRDVRLLRLYEGTSEIQRLIIGANLVKTAQREST